MVDTNSFPPEITALPNYQGAFHAHRLVAEGADVLFASYPAGTDLEAHSHDTHNVGIVTKGCLFMTVEGEESSYSQGEWYTLPIGTDHTARFEEDSAIIEFWFANAP